MPEPNPVVDEDEDCGNKKAATSARRGRGKGSTRKGKGPAWRELGELRAKGHLPQEAINRGSLSLTKGNLRMLPR